MADTTIAQPPPVSPAPPDPQQPRNRNPVARIAALWAALTIVLELFAIFVPARLMGVAAAKNMVDIKRSVTVFSIAAAPVAALVWSIALYSLLRWRHRGPEPPTEDGPPIRGNTAVQTIWLLVSSALCLFLLIWGLAAIQATTPTATNAMVVDVTGQQWLWTFSYPGAGGVTSDVLYLPVNRAVAFDVTSDDVVHSFWIVQMGIKIDANPGEITYIGVTPDRLGTFTVRCAELCGIYHAYMQTQVRVVSEAAFTSWLRANGGTHVTSAIMHGASHPAAVAARPLGGLELRRGNG
jgi:cytochrome c oxidase subunit II